MPKKTKPTAFSIHETSTVKTLKNVTLLIYNLKLKLFLLITLVDFAELITEFSYTNFTVGLSNVAWMHWTDSVFTWTLSCCTKLSSLNKFKTGNIPALSMMQIQNKCRHCHNRTNRTFSWRSLTCTMRLYMLCHTTASVKMRPIPSDL